MDVLQHIQAYVLPTIRDYERAEIALTRASRSSAIDSDWAIEANEAKRHAAQAAIALDGLVDRFELAYAVSKEDIRKELEQSCIVQNRPGAAARVSGVANAYKHAQLNQNRHPIKSWAEVKAIAPGYGIDGFGVGKMGEPEVVTKDASSGEEFKFLGDIPVLFQSFIWILSARDEFCTVTEPVLGVGMRAQP